MILDDFRLDGKNALVTGSSRGLGAAIALALAEAGANVGCHGKSRDGGLTSQSIRELGRKTFFQAGDISGLAVESALVQRTVQEFGSIDILVNNAGTIKRRPASDFPFNDWTESIAVNLTAVFHMAQQVGQYMLER
ncbi:MAG: SDR family NAD(P)-dependent oxidoreductase, partial [Acidobacteria bacterium]|nr:SDR family NAD(P)-dependent oxidoreductase [Acidobacteriota bacterium]